MKEYKIGEMVITHEEQSNSTYVYLKPEMRDIYGCVKKTKSIETDGTELINIDYDEKGEIIGIEIIKF